MRILFLSASNPFPKANAFAYGGGGWITSLIRLLNVVPHIEMGVVYATSLNERKYKYDTVEAYPVFVPALTKWQKIVRYYGGYKNIDFKDYVIGALDAIKEFNPDIIHLFGLESPFANVISNTEVPVVCHLQGLLPPIYNAYYPGGMNDASLLWPPSKREWILRNGYLYAKKSLGANANRNIGILHRLSYAMGRTEWDKEVSQLLAPQSKYFHVDEVLRQPFYDHAGEWETRQNGRLVIISTLSETVYKGLDLVLKTARLLKENTDIDFEWNIIGIEAGSIFVKFFEHSYGIKSNDVNVRYLGVKSPDEIINLQLGATVYVHTSYIDNSPNSVCEAQMVGCPVIATNVGGVSSLVKDGKTGMLVPANGSYELAYKIKLLAGDIELRQRLSDGGKEAASERHDKQAITRQLLDIYKNVIADAKSI